MKRTLASLLFLLGVQLTLTAILYWPTDDSGDANDSLLSPAAALSVDSMTLSDDLGNAVDLEKHSGRWVLPGLHNLPANSAQIQQLLDTLTSRSPGFPVATSVAARQRFQVTSYLFRRSLVLRERGTEVATVYFGLSSGYRHVYARREDREAIVSLDYRQHEAPATPEAWMDRGLLQVESLGGISVDGLALQRAADGRWLTAGGAPAEPREIEALLEMLRTLQVSGLPDEDRQRSLATEGQPLRTLEVETGGRRILLELFSEDGKAFVKDSRYPLFFGISGRTFQRLMGLERRRLGGDTSAGSAGTVPAEDNVAG